MVALPQPAANGAFAVVGRSWVVGVMTGSGCAGRHRLGLGIRYRLRKRSEAESSACMDGGCWLSADARDKRFGKMFRSAEESVT